MIPDNDSAVTSCAFSIGGKGDIMDIDWRYGPLGSDEGILVINVCCLFSLVMNFSMWIDLDRHK